MLRSTAVVPHVGLVFGREKVWLPCCSNSHDSFVIVRGRGTTAEGARITAATSCRRGHCIRVVMMLLRIGRTSVMHLLVTANDLAHPCEIVTREVTSTSAASRSSMMHGGRGIDERHVLLPPARGCVVGLPQHLLRRLLVRIPRTTVAVPGGARAALQALTGLASGRAAPSTSHVDGGPLAQHLATHHSAQPLLAFASPILARLLGERDLLLEDVAKGLRALGEARVQNSGRADRVDPGLDQVHEAVPVLAHARVAQPHRVHEFQREPKLTVRHVHVALVESQERLGHGQQAPHHHGRALLQLGTEIVLVDVHMRHKVRQRVRVQITVVRLREIRGRSVC
mmetsp:Transcript_3177/g.7453  ORF Transcript_3177/g.7453 Transcript_3177/m.7453 type:complete len:340 (+) Transcript_3177:1511-2530(+)